MPEQHNCASSEGCSADCLVDLRQRFSYRLRDVRFPSNGDLVLTGLRLQSDGTQGSRTQSTHDFHGS
jgi:hypothetical protein